MPVPAIYTPQDLEQRAQGLNYYGGEDEAYSYDGEGDPFVNFDGQDVESFAGQSGDRVVSITIDNNNTSSALRLFLHKGYNRIVTKQAQARNAAGTGVVTFEVAQNAPGMAVREGFVPDIGGIGTSSADGLTLSSTGIKSWEDFQNFLTRHPTLLTGIGITTETFQQAAMRFTNRKISPYKDGESSQIRPGDTVDQNTFNGKTIKLPVNLLLGYDNELEYLVAASSSVTLDFYCGGNWDPSKAMKQRANVAYNNIQGRRRRR